MQSSKSKVIGSSTRVAHASDSRVGLASTTSVPEIHSVVKDVSFSLYENELMVVIGQVGSGKSSLLATIMRETIVQTGSISSRGSIAYVEQEPFILSDTVMNNILLGK